jgi:hypothetical protein
MLLEEGACFVWIVRDQGVGEKQAMAAHCGKLPWLVVGILIVLDVVDP